MPDFTAADAKLAALVTKVAAAQVGKGNGGPKCVQIRNSAAEWLAKANVAAGALAGVTAQVNEYEGPSGKGWELGVTVTIATVTYRRVVHVGPETWRAQAWAVVPGAIP